MARLSRFYGGDPVAWLTSTPIALVRACAAMLPRLQAEESMQAAERAAVGAGTLKRESARQITRRWQQSAGGDARIATRRRAGRAQLAAMGISVVEVPSPAGGEA